jgi:polyphosphate glucokinase
MAKSAAAVKILTLDIGGSHIKATILNGEGKPLMESEKVPTPLQANPDSLISSIKVLVINFPAYDKISAGFPGYVKNGIIQTAPNLDSASWNNVDMSKKLQDALGKPAKVVNDADLQGLGIVSRKGLEMVITLGTGFGTALLKDGNLLPHMELAHHPFTKKKTYDDYVGQKELDKVGKAKWNKRMKKVLQVLKEVFNYDQLYISGGNADKLNFELDKNIKIGTNKDGIKGGARLWLSNQEQ